MLNNIKSIFLIKMIFSNSEEKPKLELIKYNKNLQKILNINIINYKFFSGKYIIYISKGIGKEYDGYNNNLIYEGKYKKGKKNGKGVEYCKGEYFNYKFEGEYLNEKKMEKEKNFMKMD